MCVDQGKGLYRAMIIETRLHFTFEVFQDEIDAMRKLLEMPLMSIVNLIRVIDYFRYSANCNFLFGTDAYLQKMPSYELGTCVSHASRQLSTFVLGSSHLSRIDFYKYRFSIVHPTNRNLIFPPCSLSLIFFNSLEGCHVASQQRPPRDFSHSPCAWWKYVAAYYRDRLRLQRNSFLEVQKIIRSKVFVFVRRMNWPRVGFVENEFGWQRTPS